MPYIVIAAVVVAAWFGKKYYKIWYGECDECGKTDRHGLIKTDIIWSDKLYICHGCQEVYRIVILGQKVPEDISVAGADVSAEVQRKRWAREWIREAFFKNQKPKD